MGRRKGSRNRVHRVSKGITNIQDIRLMNDFSRFGDKFVFVDYYPETDTYVYERWSPTGELRCWEVVRPNYIVLEYEDGDYAYYPPTVFWGRLGLTVINTGHSPTLAVKYVKFLAETKDWDEVRNEENTIRVE